MRAIAWYSSRTGVVIAMREIGVLRRNVKLESPLGLIGLIDQFHQID
jgi:hypothetical protein